MKNKLYIYVIVLGIACMFNSCITGRHTNYLQKGGSHKPVAFQQYKLRIDDEISYYLLTSNLETQMFYNNGVAGAFVFREIIKYRIHNDGMVYLPIGAIKIAGLTLREAQNVIKDAFLKFVPDAEIKLTMVNNYFYVLGDGGKGEYVHYKEDLNIFQALAMAGDISSSGDKKHIKIVRKGADGMDYIKTFDLREKSIIESEFYYIQPNDVIYIPTNSNSFFRLNSVSSFMALIVTPLSFFAVIMSIFK